MHLAIHKRMPELDRSLTVEIFQEGFHFADGPGAFELVVLVHKMHRERIAAAREVPCELHPLEHAARAVTMHVLRLKRRLGCRRWRMRQHEPLLLHGLGRREGVVRRPHLRQLSVGCQKKTDRR